MERFYHKEYTNQIWKSTSYGVKHINISERYTWTDKWKVICLHILDPGAIKIHPNKFSPLYLCTYHAWNLFMARILAASNEINIFPLPPSNELTVHFAAVVSDDVWLAYVSCSTPLTVSSSITRLTGCAGWSAISTQDTSFTEPTSVNDND
jgi:hypothetical protein